MHINLAQQLLQSDTQLRWSLVRCFIKIYLHRFGSRLIGGDNGVARAELRATLDLHPAEPDPNLGQILALPSPQALIEEALSLQNALQANQHLAAEHGVVLPFERLRVAFHLSAFELYVLSAVLAIQSDVPMMRLARLAWADFARVHPTVGFLSELLELDASDVGRTRAILQPTQPLATHHLLDLSVPQGMAQDLPLALFNVSIPRAVEDFLLLGLAPSSDTLGFWRLVEPSEEGMAKSDALMHKIAELLQRSDAKIVLVGASGAGRTRALFGAAHQLSRSVVVLSLDMLLRAYGHNPASIFDVVRPTCIDACREAQLHRAVLLIRHMDALEALDVACQAALSVTITELNRLKVPLAMTSEKSLHSVDAWLRGVVEVGMPPLSRDAQTQLWAQALTSASFPAPLVDLTATRISAQFPLPRGAIPRIISRAQDRARAAQRTLSEFDLDAALQREFTHKLGHLADRLTTTLDWDDLVLPKDLKEEIGEVIQTVQQRERVLSDWGFGRKMDRGRGVSCLFDGPPGTGKTMTALLLGKSLAKDVYRIDLSKIVDKYIGETEKNLAKIFDEADRSQAVILFDEADSLFAKRTKVSSSNDRYANLEVNFLLQRLEAYDGVCILTTNLESSLDEAFKRRIRFRLTFPFPDRAQRADLWRRVLPSEAEIDPDINFFELGAGFELSGGGIKNAVLRAAFNAASRNDIIRMEDLEWAALRECAKMGQLIRGNA